MDFVPTKSASVYGIPAKLPFERETCDQLYIYCVYIYRVSYFQGNCIHDSSQQRNCSGLYDNSQWPFLWLCYFFLSSSLLYDMITVSVSMTIVIYSYFSWILPLKCYKLRFSKWLSWLITNNVLGAKIDGPVWYTIYHHLLPVVKRGFFKPFYSSSNQWEFGTSMLITGYSWWIFMGLLSQQPHHRAASGLSGSRSHGA